MGLKFGLDIGIASVGWSVVDIEKGVVDSGARIFDSADASKNVTRRERRGARRLLRRKGHRNVRFEKFWREMKLTGIQEKNDPLRLRNKGIHERLDQDELYTVLKNMLKHRGISYMDDALDDNAKNQYQEALKRNSMELQEKHPCEIQLERLEEFGHYRGDQIVTENSEEIALSNVYTTSAYRRELDKLFEVQRQYHVFLNDNFVQKYLDIFESKRKYYEGPGNEQSRTDYGKYTTEIDSETGEYITEENIFEKLIGKCSVYPDEIRASAASYTAQEFNLLNDLNNFTVNGNKLSREQKEEIIDLVLSNKTVNIRKIIEKVLGEKIVVLKGTQIDKNDKEVFNHKFDIYKKMRNTLEEIDFNIEELSRKEIDQIAYILTINTDKESLLEAFKKNRLKITKQVVEQLIDFRKSNGSLFNKWHRLSLKIMNEIMEDLYEESKNQMQLLTEMGIFKTNIEKFKQHKYIPSSIIIEEIFNPVVRKSVNQSIRVLNALIKQYGYPEDIVIEMAREDNEQDQKKRIQDGQARNEKELNEIISKVSREYGVQITDQTFYNHKALKTKLRLWNEQQGRCPYSGKLIPIQEVIEEYSKYEIDHIIPISISFDDSRSNKVLVYRSENQKKGNKTAYMYLKDNNRDWNYSKMKQYVEELYKHKHINLKKKQQLLFIEDITKQSVVEGFINRNLNDTRFASRVVLNGIQGFIRAHEKNTKVKVINGAFTSQLRHRLRLSKDRDESLSHHAVDAMIMCYAVGGLNRYKRKKQEIIDFETGEVLDEKALDKLDEKEYEDLVFNKELFHIQTEIQRAEKEVKFSHKVDKKVNRQLSNETIYGVREKDKKHYKVSKIKDIYSDNGYTSFAKRLKKNKKGEDKRDVFLMYHHDPQTFEILLGVMEKYGDEKNPFAAYLEENNEPIRKYSKKGNGPFIKSLKYYDGEVGSCIDISHKYGHKKNSRKVVLDSLNPYRMDVYYRKEDDSYHFAGVKYANFKFDQGKYCLDDESYNEVLVAEKILKPGQDYKELKSYGYEFCLSIYKNNLIQYEKNGEYFVERFLSRTMPNVKNYIETKPINAQKFEKQNKVGLAKTKSVVKINTDILGNQYFVKKESFNLGFSLDN